MNPLLLVGEGSRLGLFMILILGMSTAWALDLYSGQGCNKRRWHWGTVQRMLARSH